MKTEKSFESGSYPQMDKSINIPLSLMACLAMALVAVGLTSCSNDDNTTESDPDQTGAVMGTVKDENGNPYPNTLVTLSKGSEKLDTSTDADGNFELKTNDIGTYQITLEPPLSTEAVSANPASANVQTDQTSTVDFVVKPQAMKAHVNIGQVDILDEIKDHEGKEPTNQSEPLYAANVFDPPFGLLTAIEAPDDHHVTLSEWKEAKGSLEVHCDGNTATVNISLEGMIPNGTYTFWLAYFNKPVQVGESVNFPTDAVHPINPPLGASDGSENVLIADANGNISATITESSCILTEEVALVIPIVYHINGNTFGAAHTPDPEDAAHMLVYFQ